MKNSRRFGGYGNLFAPVSARKGRLLYAGEAAGFQDALFGFGMRYALLSGHFAALALLEGSPEEYDSLWRKRLGNLMKLAIVNRAIYEHLGDSGYARLVGSIGRAYDARDWMKKYYGHGRLKRLLYPLVRRQFSSRADPLDGCIEGCDCTLCRCKLAGGCHLQERGKP
jgi:flavin-dependent dehydrogenase